MHDFSCTDAKDMYNKVLADRVRYFKEDERGVEIMCREMEIMRNQAHEEGIEKGRIMQLIKQVCVKMQKFSSAEEVANDLVEQDVPLIQKIMNVAPDFAPDYNVNDIYNALSCRAAKTLLMQKQYIKRYFSKGFREGALILFLTK